MKKYAINVMLCSLLIVLGMGILSVNDVFPCSRAVYLGPEDTVITARSMDWVSDLGRTSGLFPRGIERDGAAGPQSIHWTSKYGSVAASAFDAGTADGMNEKGLVANLLYLSESEYVKPSLATGGNLYPFRSGHSTFWTTTQRLQRRCPTSRRNRFTSCR